MSARRQVAGGSYPSDLSDKQWQKLARFFERPDPRGAHSKYAKRRVVEAVLLPGEGAEVTGQLLRMDQTIAFEDPDHDVKDQYFTLADGTGTRWLAHRYAYVRRP